jgi:fructose-bisphosphate aldolase class I
LGKDENVKAAQEVLLIRGKANSLASLGQYDGGLGGEGSDVSTYVKGYVY